VSVRGSRPGSVTDSVHCVHVCGRTRLCVRARFRINYEPIRIYNRISTCYVVSFLRISLSLSLSLSLARARSVSLSRSGQAIYSSSKDGYRVYMRGTSGGVNSWTMNALQHRFRVYGVGFRI